MKFFRGFDLLIPAVVAIIGALGLALLWSLTPNLFFQQLVFFLIGFIFFLIFSQIDFRIWQNLRWVIYIGGILFLVLTFILGGITRGSVRWIQIGPLTIQASEMVKPFFLAFFAFWFSQGKFQISKLIIAIFLFFLPALLIFRQPDLGSTLVLTVAFLGIFFALDLPAPIIWSGVAFFILLLPSSWLFLAQYQKQRILSFLNPGADPLGSGYNIIQSVISVGSGQLFGRGLGKGTQSHLAFLPERHTDFIFASYTEELGFLGAIIILVLYFLLLWRVLRVALKTQQDYARLFSLGVFFMLLFQIFVNIGMNLGIVPVTGITLPFFSYGGSSILATMIALGMVESIARFQKEEGTIEIK